MKTLVPNQQNRHFQDKRNRELEFIQSLPKAELHCHIDGSIRPSTILDIAIKEGIKVPTRNITEFTKFVQVNKENASLVEYLQKFDLPLKVFNKPQNIKRITLEFIEDASIEGIKYIELRFSPFSGPKDISERAKVEAVLMGMREGEGKYGVSSGLILCGMRNESVQQVKDVVNLALSYKDNGVVAVDLAGDEMNFPPEIHKDAFVLAHNSGLKVTIHAGETGRSDNIIRSINLLKADRIGHGFSAINDESLIKELVSKQIPLEICIKSNLDTNGVKSIRLHPIMQLYKKGVKVTLNTDNKTVSNVTLMQEYDKLLKIGFSIKDIVKIVRNGIEVSFAPKHVKESLLRELRQKEKNFLSFSQGYKKITSHRLIEM